MKGKKYELIINPFAEQDLQDAKSYYDSNNAKTGGEFVREVGKTIQRITEQPEQFPEEKREIRKALVNRFPYAVFFYVKGLLINVFAVFHTNRNPETWQNRIKE